MNKLSRVPVNQELHSKFYLVFMLLVTQLSYARYFLITPKLLPDLYYNERMRVLCIYNGEWQPKRLKPLTEYLRRARASA